MGFPVNVDVSGALGQTHFRCVATRGTWRATLAGERT